MPVLMPLFDDAVLKRRAEIVAALRAHRAGRGRDRLRRGDAAL